jgi:hypothetical protein
VQGFPQYITGPGASLWRIHGSSFGPWFFRNDGLFRFDLTGRPGWGTCYFAEAPLGAFVETLQGFRTVPLPRRELAARRLFQYHVKHALVFADVTGNDAARFGLDASIAGSSPGDYDASQRFASDAFDEGFSGVRYRVRHDLRQTSIGIALFGPQGAQPDDLLEGEDDEIEEALVAEACREAAFRTPGPLLDGR